MTKFQFLFESDPATSGYVGVLGDSPSYQGPLACQNAGSTNGTGVGDIYYQVGGGGVNGLFASALGPTLTGELNGALKTAYDQRFGSNAWQTDSDASRGDRLASFYCPIAARRPAGAHVGPNVVGMVYSVGPQLQGHIDPGRRAAFRQVYVEALQAVAAAQRAAGTGAPRIALRLTLLSTGIYGGVTGSNPGEKARRSADLSADVAALVLEAVAQAAKGTDAADLPTTLLINNSQLPAGPGTGKEYEAFDRAAKALKLSITPGGFEFCP